ncbi:carbohydrate esterase family 1 protein [Macroventuria anomochaeta]|uniref:Carbohydrate esterase family 1 protein n=1 Tax=Macroventuria anomochaeta TaxID=301207 RepID=A0ACB6S8C5_9PLEO|nr:carbohydrate esterase family 1 protein [Macroventuria anomochaeta]KAF2630466.1 carbohydrate esterase family 1 protein [Macroventuria anomochaeta]
MISLLLLGTAILAALPGISCAPVKDTKCGCGSSLPEGIELDKSVNLTISSSSGVATRGYRLHLPKSYDTIQKVPLILSFHGRGKDAKFQEELSQFSNATYGFDGISVYPEGIPTSKGTQQWQGDPNFPSSINDVAFTLELLDDLQKTYCIDTSRIYAAGKSNGAGFTGVLACDAEATKRIAAFAPVSGAFYLGTDQELPPCNPSRHPIPIMEFHGFKDTTIPYAGGINTRGNANSTNMVTWVDDWAKRDGFQVTANKTSYLCSENKKVTRYSWNETVVHYNYTNLYHDWPSSFPNGDTVKALTCEEAEATSIILEWLKKWSL